MTAPRKITLQQLIALGACKDQRDEFKRRFGSSVEVTEELCASVADVFDWGWIAYRTLSASARAEYRRVSASAWAEYQRVVAPAWAEYQRVVAPAWAEYQRVSAPAWAEYRRVSAPAWAEYRRVSARTFARLYNSQEG